MAKWCMVGGGVVPPNGVVFNPPSEIERGLVGQVAPPYVVPAGFMLNITGIVLEPLWGAAVIVQIGETANGVTVSSEAVRPAMTPSGFYNVVRTVAVPVDYMITEGTQVSIRLSAGLQPKGDWVYSYAVFGNLISADQS